MSDSISNIIVELANVHQAIYIERLYREHGVSNYNLYYSHETHWLAWKLDRLWVLRIKDRCGKGMCGDIIGYYIEDIFTEKVEDKQLRQMFLAYGFDREEVQKHVDSQLSKYN